MTANSRATISSGSPCKSRSSLAASSRPDSSATKTDSIDATSLARLAFEKRPEPTRLHDEVAENLRELVRHRDRLRQDFGDRVRQLHRLVDLGFPEFTRYVRNLDSMLATCLLTEYPKPSLARPRGDWRSFATTVDAGSVGISPSG